MKRKPDRNVFNIDDYTPNPKVFGSPMEAPRPKRERLLHSQEEFVRVPWYVLQITTENNGFPTWVRLYLCLRYRTREGTEWVPLTAKLATEAGIISRQAKYHELLELEARQLVEVRRDGNKTPLVRALPYARRRE